MKSEKIILTFATVLQFCLLNSGTAQCRKCDEKVNNPGRFFTVPNTEILPVGSFSLGGGQAFGKLGSEFLGKLGVGIAPYTEVQINTQKAGWI